MPAITAKVASHLSSWKQLWPLRVLKFFNDELAQLARRLGYAMTHVSGAAGALGYLSHPTEMIDTTEKTVGDLTRANKSSMLDGEGE